MPTGLRALQIRMGGLAEDTAKANDEIERGGRLLLRLPRTATASGGGQLAALERELEQLREREAAVRHEIDTAPAVVSARQQLDAITAELARLTAIAETTKGEDAERYAATIAKLESQRAMVETRMADIQTEIDARFAALAEDEARIRNAIAALGGGQGVADAAAGDRSVTVSDEIGPDVEAVLYTIRSLRVAVEAHAQEVRSVIEQSGEEMQGLSYDIFRTLNATEFDVEEFVSGQQELLQTLRRSGLGEYIDAYAVAFERLRRQPNLSPQMGRELSIAMQQIRELVQMMGGSIGRRFNFGQLEREIDQRAADYRRSQRYGRTSGTLGSDASSDREPSFTLLRAQGALR